MNNAGTGTVRDLVCGMDIRPEEAAATSEYNGQTYYFCAPGCKREFDRNPEKYVSGQGSEHSHQH